VKVCFLMLSHWSGSLGGAELQVRYIMQYLRRHSSHELSMVCRHTRMTEEEGVPIHRTRALQPLGRYFKAADYFSVMRHLARIDPDVIYTRVGSPFVGFAADFCRRRDRRLIYHVASIEDVTPLRLTSLRKLPARLERPLYEYGLRHADCVIAQSHDQAKLLARHFQRSCTVVLPNIHPVPSRVEKPSAPRTVLWVGNLKPRKNPEAMVGLAQRLSHLADVRFEMIGAVHDRGYENFAERLAHVPNLSYAGPLPVEEVNRRLERAHLLVNTSARIDEGFPNTFIQAWLREVPVASLEVDPDARIARHDLGTVAEGSPERMAEQVASLLGAPDRLRAVGERARRHAQEHFGLERCRAILALIERGSLAGVPATGIAGERAT
jgi:glycosyltransferase involved in cell wall biosynthesis